MLAFTDYIILFCLLIIVVAIISFVVNFIRDHPRATVVIFILVGLAYAAEVYFKIL